MPKRDESLNESKLCSDYGAKIEENPDSILIEFETLQALSAVPKKLTIHGDSWTYGKSFGSYETYREACRVGEPPSLYLERYEAILGGLDSVVDQFRSRARSARKRRVYREYGDELDFDRRAVHNPEHWVSRTRGAVKKLVRLGIQACHTASSSESVFVEIAGIAAAAADVLTLAGFAVEIDAVWQTYGTHRDSRYKGREVVTYVPIKRSTEPLDIRNILTAASPGLLRHSAIGTWEATCKSRDSWNNSVRSLGRFKARETLGLDATIGESWEWSPDGVIKHDPELDGLVESFEGVLGRKLR